MAVRLRLMRMGKTKQPTYRVVAADKRKARNGRFIEIIGFYDPRRDPSVIDIENEKAVKWLHQGALPSERVEKLLKISGAWDEFKGLPPGTSSVVATVGQLKSTTESPDLTEANQNEVIGVEDSNLNAVEDLSDPELEVVDDNGSSNEGQRAAEDSDIQTEDDLGKSSGQGGLPEEALVDNEEES